MQDLQLKDYLDGYRFLVKCRLCDYAWKIEPAHLMNLTESAGDLTLNEITAVLACRNRDCRSRHLRLTPLRQRGTHHFVGGLA
jgi:hypothetical protein